MFCLVDWNMYVFVVFVCVCDILIYSRLSWRQTITCDGYATKNVIKNYKYTKLTKAFNETVESNMNQTNKSEHITA